MAYTPLRISTVKPERELTFDLYIFFKENYLCYLKKGDQLEPPKYKKLKKQKIAKFYVTEEDEPNYQTFLDNLLNEAINSDDMAVEEKVNIVEGAAENAMEKMQKDPGSESAFKQTENAAKSLRQVISKNPEALKQIFGKKASEGDNELIIKHSLNVCALSTKLAEMKGSSEEELDNLATAALMHDIGVTMIDDEVKQIFKKQKSNFTPDDIRAYNDHCRVSVKLLEEKPFINKEILELIANHEETKSGDGPNKKAKLSQLEEILSLVNKYDKRVLLSGEAPKDVIKNMVVDEMGNYELDLINDFKSILKSEGLLDD